MDQLIRDLNDPRNQGQPQIIHNIQRQIQQLQRDVSSWQTGLRLLDSDEQLLQFYGALTISIKVSNDWDADQIGQDRQQVAQLLQHLVSRFVHLAVNSNSSVVLTKLASTLAAVFSKPDVAWAHPCRHVLACILEGQYVTEETVPDTMQVINTQKTVTGNALMAVLRLALALQEELGSVSKIQPGHRAEVRLSNNATDAWHIICFALEAYALQAGISQQGEYGLGVEATESEWSNILLIAVQQIPAWTKQIALLSDDNAESSRLFRRSIQLALQLLSYPPASEACISCLASLQAEHHRLLRKATPEYCTKVNCSEAAARWSAELLDGEFSPAANSYVEFLDAVISQLDTTTDEYLQDDAVKLTLERVQALLRCKGAAMVEDEVCQTVLEIMTTVAEGYSDWSDGSPFDESMITLIKEVCLATLVKCQFPTDELDKRTTTWQEDDFTRFEDYRFQASDFFQTAFGIIGPSLAEDIAGSICHDVNAAWPEFEAGVFVLTAVSDALSNEPERCDPFLNEVFSSEIWRRATSAENHVPGRVRRSVIRLLAETTSYLQRNPQYLIGSLDFLFRSLKIRSHSNQAARAIYNLCDAQRSYLVQALPQFLQTITSLENIPLHSRCKILSGVSALVQSLPTEVDKVNPLTTLLQLINDLESKHSLEPPTNDDEVYDPLFDRVSMLAAIAKGLQSPADTPIELDASDKNDTRFWLDGPGREIQERVLHLLSEPWSKMLEPDQLELVTAACEFLRAGFKEPHPVATKFSSETSTNLLCSLISLQNPNLDQTMNTASCFLASFPFVENSSSVTEAEKLISRAVSVTQEAISTLATSSDFAAPISLLDFFIRSLPKFGTHILTSPSALPILTTFTDYATLLLRSQNDTLPRRASATFFTSLLDHTDPATSALMQSPTSAQPLLAFLDTSSPTLLGLTLHYLSGECARSEIESLASLLRAFTSKQPARTKRILQEAINPESGVLSAKAIEATKPEQRSRFIAQIEALRGGRKTTEIVKEWWLACRGAEFGYVT